MRVADCMSRDVRIANPDESLREVARAMAQIDSGVLPVGDGDRLVGMITDRDIAVRGVAEGKGPDARVREVMSAEVRYCFDDEDIGEVLRNMGEIQVRRLPVLNRDKRLVGMISIGDLAKADADARMGGALADIARPGGEHSQTAH